MYILWPVTRKPFVYCFKIRKEHLYMNIKRQKMLKIKNIFNIFPNNLLLI